MNNSPYEATLLLTTVGVASSALEAFVGSSPRTVAEFPVKCLYVKNVEATERKKFGFSDNVTGIVYLTPGHLIELFGDYHLDALKTQVKFFDHIDNIESIAYNEELFGSCVAVVLGLRSAATGT